MSATVNMATRVFRKASRNPMRILAISATVVLQYGYAVNGHAVPLLGYVGFATVLARLKTENGVPVLFPTDGAVRRSLLTNSNEPLFLRLEQTNPGDTYYIFIGSIARCYNTPCTIGSLEGARPKFAEEPYKAQFFVTLANGVKGTYQPPNMGDVSNATLTWTMRYGSYRLSIKEGRQKAMIAVADSAILHGPWR